MCIPAIRHQHTAGGPTSHVSAANAVKNNHNGTECVWYRGEIVKLQAQLKGTPWPLNGEIKIGQHCKESATCIRLAHATQGTTLCMQAMRGLVQIYVACLFLKAESTADPAATNRSTVPRLFVTQGMFLSHAFHKCAAGHRVQLAYPHMLCTLRWPSAAPGSAVRRACNTPKPCRHTVQSR